MACALNDLEVLKRCIPGCERLEKEFDTEMTAMVVLRVGPVKATFEGVFRRGDMLDKIGHFPDQSAKPFCDDEVIVRHDNARSQCMLPTGIFDRGNRPFTLRRLHRKAAIEHSHTLLHVQQSDA